MKTSLIIITKNRVKELDDCLNSIEKQDVLPNEIIIVDSSTNNETKNILKKFENLNIRYFKFSNGGTSKARNYGIKNAKGDIIIFIDDDVLLHKTYIKEILNYFINNPDIGAITGPTYDIADIISGNISDIEIHNLLNNNDQFFKAIIREVERVSKNKFVNIYRNYRKNKFKRLLLRMIRIIFLLDSFQPGRATPSGFVSTHWPKPKPYNIETLNGCNMAFRKDVLDKYKFNEDLEAISNYAIYEDHEMGYRISREYQIKMVPTIILCHRKTPSARVSYLEYYDAIISDVYYIVKNDLGSLLNRIAFAWCLFGIIFALSVLFLIKPNVENRDKLKGVLNGAKRILGYKL